ncbi:MAG: nucleoside triphosphate pyrophosphohydrolase family protein [Succinivibrionaceae bacterium]|nr:nucleoside triphosphate pyrophosphohydrolase family protein [Succinivibrionaceae bacterium]
MVEIVEYKELAMRTSPNGHDRVLNGCLGLIGESGEVVDIIKKFTFQSGENPEFPTDKMVEECGDVLWYVAELCAGLGLDATSIYINGPFNYVPSFDSSLEKLGVLLASSSARIAYCNLHGNSTETDDKNNLWAIVGIINSILMFYCKTTLGACMDRNIEKLRKRYPDGFDPERSLHRAAEEA